MGLVLLLGVCQDIQIHQGISDVGLVAVLLLPFSSRDMPRKGFLVYAGSWSFLRLLFM